LSRLACRQPEKQMKKKPKEQRNKDLTPGKMLGCFGFMTRDVIS